MNDRPSHFPTHDSPPHHPPVERRGHGPLLFVTACTARREPALANDPAHRLLLAAWRAAAFWRVGRYVVMPDHVHLFCTPARDDVRLVEWVRFWKSFVARRWAPPRRRSIWQPSFWDTQVRGYESYSRKWDYVRLNPVRRGLVETPEAWPYAGEIEILDWP